MHSSEIVYFPHICPKYHFVLKSEVGLAIVHHSISKMLTMGVGEERGYGAGWDNHSSELLGKNNLYITDISVQSDGYTTEKKMPALSLTHLRIREKNRNLFFRFSGN